jgi:hypothetical protein
MPLLKPPRAAQVNWSHHLAGGLSGCWLLAEGTGDKAADLGPYRQRGISQGGPPLWKPGEHGCCLEFDGTDECIDCGSGKFGWNISNELSVVAYIKPDVAQANTIFARSAFARPVLLSGYSGGRVRWRVYTDSTDCDITSTSSHATDGSEWIHAVGTWRQNDGRIYVNGELENSESSSNGNLSFISDSQFVGIGGAYEGSNYYNCWDGRIEYIFVYNRALSAEQVKWLYREPFAMFESSISLARVVAPIAAISLAGSITAQSAASATLESLTGISGTITSTSCTAALLKSVSGLQRAKRSWPNDALFNGMTASAFKLGTTLSLGWFWLRTAGCSVLYRGLSMGQIDFADMLTVAAPNAAVISPPSYIQHDASSTHFYVVRRFNNCGYLEHTLAAAVKVSIDSDGELQEPHPNKVFNARVEQVDGNAIRLVWFYCPLEQKSSPACFNIYYDNRTGIIDYENPIAEIAYQGRKFHSYQSGTLDAGRYLFAIMTEDANGVENRTLAQLRIQLHAESIDPVEILSAERV